MLTLQSTFKLTWSQEETTIHPTITASFIQRRQSTCPFYHREIKSEFGKAYDYCHFMTNGYNCFPESRIGSN